MGKTHLFIVFIGIALTVYSLMNAYFIFKSRHFFSFQGFQGKLLITVLVLLYLLPVATFTIPRAVETHWNYYLSFAGYSWLAFLFLFLAWHVILDIVLWFPSKTSIPVPDSAYRFLGIVIFGILVLTYGFFEAQQIQIKNLTFYTNKLPENTQSIKVAQISDVHFSSLTGIKTAKKIRAMLEGEQPDILVMTGDLIDHGLINKQGVSEELKALSPLLGAYAITGNHEFIAGIEPSVRFIEDSGFELLRNRSKVIENLINIVGRDDLAGPRFEQGKPIKDKELFREVDQNLFTLFLKHQPYVEEDSLPYFDLMLSGHTHAGQIFPFKWLVRLVFPYVQGFYSLSDKTGLYVNPGTGTWGPPFRFLSPPEISIFHIKRQPES